MNGLHPTGAALTLLWAVTQPGRGTARAHVAVRLARDASPNLREHLRQPLLALVCTMFHLAPNIYHLPPPPLTAS